MFGKNAFGLYYHNVFITITMQIKHIFSSYSITEFGHLFYLVLVYKVNYFLTLVMKTVIYESKLLGFHDFASPAFRQAGSYLSFISQAPTSSLRLPDNWSFTVVNSQLSVFASLEFELSSSDTRLYGHTLFRILKISRKKQK